MILAPVRPSSADRFIACPSSILETEFPWRPRVVAAGLGSAAHSADAAHVRGETPNLFEILLEHGLDEDDYTDLRVAFYTFKKLYDDRLSAIIQGSILVEEERLTAGLCDGTPDLIAYGGKETIVWDWKHGRVEKDHRYQVGTYAHGVRAKYGMPPSGRILGVTVWVRTGVIVVDEWTDDALTSLEFKFADAQSQVGKAYAVNPHCDFCPRQMECGAYTSVMVQSARLMVLNEKAELPGLEGEEEALSPQRFAELAELWPQRRDLERAIDRYRKLVQGYMESHGIEEHYTKNGYRLKLFEKSRDTLDPVKTAELLRDEYGFSDSDIWRVMTVAKGRVVSAVLDPMPASEKNAAKDEFLATLRDRGGITTRAHREISLANVGGKKHGGKKKAATRKKGSKA